MIVVDTSALMAVPLDEQEASHCDRILSTSATLLISAGTLAETLVVGRRKRLAAGMQQFVARLAMTVVPVTRVEAMRVADAMTAGERAFTRPG